MELPHECRNSVVRYCTWLNKPSRIEKLDCIAELLDYINCLLEGSIRKWRAICIFQFIAEDSEFFCKVLNSSFTLVSCGICQSKNLVLRES